MKVLGIDFTSRPSKRKPITCVSSTLADGLLHVHGCEEWSSYGPFEDALAEPGPWIAGFDFPFGLSRRFIETIGWPTTWEEYVSHVGALERSDYRKALDDYRKDRADGDKEHRRATDRVAGSISPQKLYGVPVGLMFFEGAPRLLRSGAFIAHLHPGDPARVAVEAYPGVLARQFIGRTSYKNDERKKQTASHRDARRALFTAVCNAAPMRYGFAIHAPMELCEDPGGDRLDAFLCAVQAAWAWRHRDRAFGAPRRVDPLEGWIADPGVA